MTLQLNSDDSQKIEKSTQAFEILSSLPISQRTVLIEGLVAALALSKFDALPGEKSRPVAALWDWWL